jgi:membrane protease YdiL (CAAX protease family)
MAMQVEQAAAEGRLDNRGQSGKKQAVQAIPAPPDRQADRQHSPAILPCPDATRMGGMASEVFRRGHVFRVTTRPRGRGHATRPNRKLRYVVNFPRPIIPLAIAFEGALGVVGCIVAWWFGMPLMPRLAISTTVAWRGTLALVPMLGLLAFAMRSHWPPIARLRRQVTSLVYELFGGARWWELLAVAIAAGVGEELLFRGALQPLAGRWLGATAGLVLVSVIFGALHAASVAYFVLATLVGLYLGWLAQTFGDLVTPIFVHAAYDWAALVVLRRTPAPLE